eukprot:m.66654 g.66654  ORF g.66654 m.66654 type:complete len:444 (+) comp12130_c0_seq1:295-1626(+)
MGDEDGRIRKQEADYTEEVAAALPVATALAEAGQLQDAIDSLLPLEKKARIALDSSSTSSVLEHVIKMCYMQQDWTCMCESMLMFIKRRGQMKIPIRNMVQAAWKYTQELTDKDTMLKMIDTLRTITAGKIHVEIERARITSKLAQIKEEDGNIAEAADVLQELQVETYGSMDKREKVEIILEQMRLVLAKRDFIRAQIICKKIGVKYFEEESTHDLKIKYYNQMLELAFHDSRYLDVCKYYRAIYDTPRIQEKEAEAFQAFENAVLYLVLAPFDSEQSDMIARVREDPAMEKQELSRAVLDVFTEAQVLPWSEFEELFKDRLQATEVFTATEDGAKRYETLKDRFMEHNIRTMASYYSKMHTSRLAQLLDLPEETAERYLSNLVSSKTVFAKIDRPAKMIVFERKQDTTEVLNDWASGLGKLMQLVDKATHLIQKERMVHQV